ncbi:PREDICTED: uncharacterized protein At4g06744-like [Nelumbo nucifera]|uniref:Uncharacterized protein At4g06744-like n=1 Tax=Nelumbo nucifera TaxID=4432 RepID=A0A1U8ASJ9_NELNU|nr:PREDICTED: uncharacterized protein At4g06744-like [Nelumbo nucifera]
MAMLTILSFSTKFLPFIFLILLSSSLHVLPDASASNRETLEIIIGGGGGGYYEDCPPPPPPPEPECPPPPPPPSPPPPSPPPPSPPPPSPPPPSPPPPSPPPPSPPPPSPSPPPPSPSPPPPQKSRLEMVRPYIEKLRKRITGDPKHILRTWKKDGDICQYTGLYCEKVPDYKEQALAGIDFNSYNLSGPNLTLDGIIENLVDLAIFHANSNRFLGEILSKIRNLRYFYELDLSNNNYKGEFPKAVLTAANLSFLDLRFNKFHGYLPPQVFNLGKIDVLFVNNNYFYGPIPYNLGSTPARYLTFANNQFSGSIPPSIGKAKDTLVEVLFLNNQLSGCLPYEIGFLKKATVFDAGNNHLTGPIPYSFGCLERMQLLNFTGNKLYGPVPEVVCGLPSLANFSLSDNYFTQVGPKCRELIKKGKLDIRNNCILDLPSQRPADHCEKFFSSNPKYCSDLKTNTMIPCRLRPYSEETYSTPPATAISPSPSYNALIKHRL